MTTRGVLALLGGGEVSKSASDLDRHLLEASGSTEVVVLPTAAAFENPDAVAARAQAYFEGLGATVVVPRVLRRQDAESEEHAATVRSASFVVLVDGSPLHLRSVLKGSPLFAALADAWRGGAVVAASGAGATLVCDPMVDPRGGAYTVGLGLVTGIAVFPYHGTAADHLRARSIDLLPANSLLAGVDEATAVVRDPDGSWRADGAGYVTIYDQSGEVARFHDEPIPALAGR